MYILSAGMPRQSGDSYSNEVIRRMLQVLTDHGLLKKTRLAGKAGINYGTCKKYLHLLKRLQWVETVHDKENGELVSISSDGILILRKLQNEKILATDMSSSSLHPQQDTLERRSSTTGHRLSTMAARRKAKNIVIVDDNENTLLTYRLFLETLKDYRVRTFSDPKKALEFLILHPNSYDLVLLDIRMPGMSGLRLFQGIKASNPNARIIFLSSLDAAPELVEIFREVKPNQFLRKPISRDEFIEAVSASVS